MRNSTGTAFVPLCPCSQGRLSTAGVYQMRHSAWQELLLPLRGHLCETHFTPFSKCQENRKYIRKIFTFKRRMFLSLWGRGSGFWRDGFWPVWTWVGKSLVIGNQQPFPILIVLGTAGEKEWDWKEGKEAAKNDCVAWCWTQTRLETKLSEQFQLMLFFLFFSAWLFSHLVLFFFFKDHHFFQESKCFFPLVKSSQLLRRRNWRGCLEEAGRPLPWQVMTKGNTQKSV